jgi:hypothetical protein
MATLTAKTRGAIRSSLFALPGRRYPIEDRAHASNAKARAAQFATPAERKIIDAKANRVLARTKK